MKMSVDGNVDLRGRSGLHRRRQSIAMASIVKFRGVVDAVRGAVEARKRAIAAECRSSPSHCSVHQ
jgi:hypothetical protein